MSNYKSTMRCAQDGSVIEVIDEREVEAVRSYRLSSIRKRAAREIEESVPEFKQRNIAMGVITGSEKTALVAAINVVREYCNGLEEQINAVTWDGEADTRAEACNAIESVGWNYEG